MDFKNQERRGHDTSELDIIAGDELRKAREAARESCEQRAREGQGAGAEIEPDCAT